MNKRICDVCENNDASTSYKIKKSTLGRHYTGGSGARGIVYCWGLYEKIDVCEDCAEKILGITTRTIPPAHK